MGQSYIKKALSYFSKHPAYNATVHAIGGAAIGILITSPIVNPHPIRWALVLGAISILGHLYAWAQR